jgi:hypothetical protein
MPKKAHTIINVVDAMIAYAASVCNPYIARHGNKGSAADSFHAEFRRVLEEVAPHGIDISRCCVTARSSLERLSKLMVCHCDR